MPIVVAVEGLVCGKVLPLRQMIAIPLSTVNWHFRFIEY